MAHPSAHFGDGWPMPPSLCPSRFLLVTLSGYDHDLREIIEGEQSGQGGQPFLRIIGPRRQSEVEHCHRGTARSECLQRAGPVLGEEDFIILTERPLHLGANLLV